MAKQTFTAGQVLTAAEMNSLQENDYNWTVTTKTASYTLAAGDEGTRIVMDNAGATTITVDDAIFSAGDVVWLHNIGAGTCTITAGTATVSTVGDLALEQYAGGHLYFTSASAAIFFPTEQGGGGKILQIVQTVKTDMFTTTSTSTVNVTGTDVAITPSSTSSKILIRAVGIASNTGVGSAPCLHLRRGTTNLATSTGATNNQTQAVFGSTPDVPRPFAMEYLDSPATTSALTYRIGLNVASGGTARVGGGNSVPDYGGVTVVTVMEVSA